MNTRHVRQLFQDHFSAIAKSYASFRPRYPAALFDWLATLVPRDSLVWDCGCGNGQAAVDLATRFACVIAMDASQEQIATAKAHPNVEYRVAPAEHCELPDKSVALITVAAALHWFDLKRFYAEAKRVLGPNGVLVAWACPVIDVEGGRINHLVQKFHSNIVGSYWPSERKLAEASYRTIPFPFVEITSPKFCMEAHWTLEQLLGYLSTWSATNRYLNATGRHPLEPFSAELARVWGDANSRRLIIWPLLLRAGRA